MVPSALPGLPRLEQPGKLSTGDLCPGMNEQYNAGGELESTLPGNGLTEHWKPRN
jgi:hypothetical protein